MTSAPLPIPQPREATVIVRDALLDLLDDQTLEELVQSAVEQARVIADGDDLSGLDRKVRNLALIHTDDELAANYRDGFRYILAVDPTAEPDEGASLILGAEPVSTSVWVAFAVGVGAGIAAAAVWDWATDNESTQVIEIDGVLIEQTIDDDGRIIKQKIISGGSK